MSSEEKGHSSYSVWLIYTLRAIEKILPALKGKQKWGWVAPFFLSLIVLLTAIGIGIYADGYGLHPPAQYTGLCASPDTISRGNCVEVISVVVTVSGTQTTQARTIQAGSILNATQVAGLLKK